MIGGVFGECLVQKRVRGLHQRERGARAECGVRTEYARASPIDGVKFDIQVVGYFRV